MPSPSAPPLKAPFGSETPHPETGTPETIHVDSRSAACDGGDGPLGHPRVWLFIEHRQTFCPYCSRIFVLNEGAGDDGH